MIPLTPIPTTAIHTKRKCLGVRIPKFSHLRLLVGNHDLKQITQSFGFQKPSYLCDAQLELNYSIDLCSNISSNYF
jgi:hypothetical protein